MDEFVNILKILRRQWLPASLVFSLGIAWGIWRVYGQVPIYQASAQLLLKQNLNTSANLLGQPGLLNQSDTIENQLVILQSPAFLQKVAKLLNIEKSIGQISGSLKARRVEGTDIVEITFKNPDPKLTQEFVNTLLEVYIQQDTEENLKDTLARQKFISQQLPRLEASIQQTEAKLKTFKQKNRVLDVKDEAGSTAGIISSLDSEIATTQTELDSQTARLQSLTKLFNTDPQEAVVRGFIAESPTANTLLDKLQELGEKIRVERLRFGENHPQIVYLKRQQAIFRQELQNYLQKIFVGQVGQKLRDKSIDKIIRPGPNQQQLLQDFNDTTQQVLLLKVKLR